MSKAQTLTQTRMSEQRAHPAPQGMRPAVPDVGKLTTIYLPEEFTRAEVVEVLSPTSIRVKLVTPPMAKTHGFHLNDLVVCHLRPGQHGVSRWEAER